MPHPRPGPRRRGNSRQAGFFPAFFIIAWEKEGSDFTPLAPITEAWGPTAAPASEEALGCVSAQGRGVRRAGSRRCPGFALPLALLLRFRFQVRSGQVSSLPVDGPPGKRCYPPSREGMREEQKDLLLRRGLLSRQKPANTSSSALDRNSQTPNAQAAPVIRFFRCLFWPQQTSQAPSLPAPARVDGERLVL